MPENMTRAILIGGSSHSGKSTLAAALGSRPGWTHLSTDSLARHPGRPWRVETPEGMRGIKPHVAEHYRNLSVDELIGDVLAHYKRLWPDIETLIASHVVDPGKDRLVLEGSALWPESVAAVARAGVAAVWLTASDALFEARIKETSGFRDASADEKLLMEKFLARTLRYNALMIEAVERHDLACVHVDGLSAEEVCAAVLKLAA